MITLVLSLLLPTALAADSDGDGCVDSYYDANTACVATTATLDSGVVIAANSVVGAYASVGTDTTIASSVFVGPRTTITGRVSAPGTLSVQANTTIGRSTTIGADHIIGQDNAIGRSVDIGARVETGNNVSIGYANTLGDDVVLGAGAVVGALVDIGDNTTIEAGAVIARGVTILDSGSTANIGGIIGPDAQIGSGADIAATARIRKRTTLGNNVTVLGNVRIGRDAQIGNGATIGANVRIAAGAQVTANSDVPDDTVIAAGEEFDNAASGILDTAGVKAWEDGTYASSCYTYRYPVDGHIYEGDTGNGRYIIDPAQNGSTVQVECEMTRQGGGWTLGLKAWYQGSAFGNAGAVGSISDALAHKGNGYKLADTVINQIIGPSNNMDVMADQSNYNSRYSTGNYEYIVLSNYTATWTYSALVPESLTTTVLTSYRAADHAQAWQGRFSCGTSGSTSRGINCDTPIGGSSNPAGGSGCSIDMGLDDNTGWHHFYSGLHNTDTYIYICNGPQHSSSYDLNHRFWFRPNH